MNRCRENSKSRRCAVGHLCAWHSACAISIFMGKILHSLQTEQTSCGILKLPWLLFFPSAFATLHFDTCGTYIHFRTQHTTTKTVCVMSDQDYFLNNYFQFFSKTHLNNVELQYFPMFDCWKFWLLETSKKIFTCFDLEIIQSFTKKTCW